MAGKTTTKQLQASTVRLGRAHFVYVGAFALLTVLSDAWSLIVPEVVLQRWTVAAIMLVVVAVVWFLARDATRSAAMYRVLIYTLIVLDIAVATYLVYTQRGLASRAVVLFVIPLAVAATLASRAALFATAALCTAAYAFAGIRYFVVHPGESYKIELYAELGFYCVVFFIVAIVLWTAIRHKNDA
mgnify:CR=1 FL=1